MKTISVRSELAGATIKFEFDDDRVMPTEALAQAFAKAVRKLLLQNPWDGMPPIDTALAWSLASIVKHASDLTEKPQMFVEDVISTLGVYYQ